jgi:hypothetical protein
MLHRCRWAADVGTGKRKKVVVWMVASRSCGRMACPDGALRLGMHSERRLSGLDEVCIATAHGSDSDE